MSVNVVVGALKAMALATWAGFNMFLAFLLYYMFATQMFPQPFYILWMLVLPLFAICIMITFPILWFLVVPGIAKRLMFARFRPGALQGIADDTGMFDIQQSKFELPEGIARNRLGWFLYPRPTYKPIVKGEKGKEGKEEEVDEQAVVAAEHLMLKKCILRDVGKPIWFGYRGKMGLVNPLTLAALEDKPKNPMNPTHQIGELERHIMSLNKELQKPLLKLLEELKAHLHVEPITWFDPRLIREVLPQNYTESQIDSIAYNRELYGEKKHGKDTFKIAMLLIVAVFGIIAIIGVLYFVTGGF